MELSRPGYWSGWPFPSPEALPNPGIKLESAALLVDSLPAELPGKPWFLLEHQQFYSHGCLIFFLIYCIFSHEKAIYAWTCQNHHQGFTEGCIREWGGSNWLRGLSGVKGRRMCFCSNNESVTRVKKINAILVLLWKHTHIHIYKYVCTFHTHICICV